LEVSIYTHLRDEPLCIHHPGPLFDVSGGGVWGSKRDSSPTATENGLSKASIGYIEHVCPVFESMEVAQHH